MSNDRTDKTAIEKAHEAMAAKRAAGEVDRLTPIEKANKNPKSLRMAINGKCWDCTCGQRIEIRNCSVPACTLFPVRPYQEKEDHDDCTENNPE